jgi:hypothetical protein
MGDGFGIGDDDAQRVEQTAVDDNAAVLLDPPEVGHAGLFSQDVEKVADKWEAVWVVLGDVGRAGDMTQG